MLRLYGDEHLPAVERVCIFLEEKSLEFIVSPTTPAPEIAGEAMIDNVLDGGPTLVGDGNSLITENKVLSPLGVYFFHDKCVDTTDKIDQTKSLGNTSWAEENRLALLDAYKRVNLRLNEYPYLSGNDFTIADITMYSSLRFGHTRELRKSGALAR